jgi:SAM-dependent methyltransferase
MTNPNLRKIIDLGFHPYADTFIKKEHLDKSEPVFQLACFLNKKNGTIQNTIKTNDDLRYNLYEYSYTSSNSIYSKSYWEKYAEHIIAKLNINSKSKIIEIGSNDGYLLKCLKIKTKKLWGIDASSFMCKLANSKNIRTFNLLFNFKNSKRVKKKISNADIIIANNVVNHSNDALDFFKGVKNLLKLNGIFIFEIPYWYNLVKKKQFDQIYHEHVNYFTAKSARYYLQKSGLYIYDIAETDYHGGSIRFYVGLDKKKPISEKLKNIFIKKVSWDSLMKKLI